MKYEQDPDKPFDLNNPGENVAEVAKNLGVAQSSLYRAIQKCNYTIEVFNRDKEVRQIVCTFVSLDGAKKAWLMINDLKRMGRNQLIKSEKKAAEQAAEISRLNGLLIERNLGDYLRQFKPS